MSPEFRKPSKYGIRVRLSRFQYFLDDYIKRAKNGDAKSQSELISYVVSAVRAGLTPDERALSYIQEKFGTEHDESGKTESESPEELRQELKLGGQVAEKRGLKKSEQVAVEDVAEEFGVSESTVSRRYRGFKDEMGVEVAWLISKGHAKEAAIEIVCQDLQTTTKTVEKAYDDFMKKLEKIGVPAHESLFKSLEWLFESHTEEDKTSS